MSAASRDLEISYPRTERDLSTYAYLKTGWGFTEVRNNLAHDVIVEQVLCYFEENSRSPTLFKSDFTPVRIQPSWSNSLRLPFTVKLSFHPDTNCFKVGVKYREIRSEASIAKELWCDPETKPYIIVQNIPRRQKTVFINHKSDENTALAKEVGNVLQKVGFDSYVAETRSELAVNDYWRDKLFPEIKSSIFTGIGNVES